MRARGHPEYYQDLGQSVAKEHGAYFINQFANPDNPLAHEQTTAPEILDRHCMFRGPRGTAARYYG